MLQAEQIDELVCLISLLDRQSLLHQLLDFRADFPVDFTEEFLAAQTTDRLKHLLLALCVQCQHLPALSEPTPV